MGTISQTFNTIPVIIVIKTINNLLIPADAHSRLAEFPLSKSLFSLMVLLIIIASVGDNNDYV